MIDNLKAKNWVISSHSLKYNIYFHRRYIISSLRFNFHIKKFSSSDVFGVIIALVTGYSGNSDSLYIISFTIYRIVNSITMSSGRDYTHDITFTRVKSRQPNDINTVKMRNRRWLQEPNIWVNAKNEKR